MADSPQVTVEACKGNGWVWAVSGAAELGCAGHTPAITIFLAPSPGVVAVAIFILLCMAAVAVHLYQQRSLCATTEVEGPRKQGSNAAAPRCELGRPDTVGGEQQAGL